MVRYDEGGQGRLPGPEQRSAASASAAVLSSPMAPGPSCCWRCGWISFPAPKAKAGRPCSWTTVLSASDPVRFAAGGASLGRLAGGHGQRQVFYLTAGPADVTAWRAPEQEAGCPRLTSSTWAQRKLGAAASPDSWLPTSPVRSRAGRHDPAEQYARPCRCRAWIRGPRPRKPISSTCSTGPGTLHRLHDRGGLTTVGRWQACPSSATPAPSPTRAAGVVCWPCALETLRSLSWSAWRDRPAPVDHRRQSTPAERSPTTSARKGPELLCEGWHHAGHCFSWPLWRRARCPGSRRTREAARTNCGAAGLP